MLADFGPGVGCGIAGPSPSGGPVSTGWRQRPEQQPRGEGFPSGEARASPAGARSRWSDPFAGRFGACEGFRNAICFRLERLDVWRNALPAFMRASRRVVWEDTKSASEDGMLRVMELADGARLIVETEDGDVDDSKTLVESLKFQSATDDLPDEAETVSVSMSMRKAAGLLERQIAALGVVARAAVNSVGASEIEIQAHFKFLGGVEPIPFVAAVKGEGGVKLTLRWKDAAPSPEGSGAETWKHEESD